MTINGDQVVFKGKISRWIGLDTDETGHLYEVDGTSSNSFHIVYGNVKCLLQKPKIGFIGLLDKRGRLLIYGAIGFMSGLLKCVGENEHLVSISMSGTWKRL